MGNDNSVLGFLVDEVASRMPGLGAVVREADESWVLRFESGHVLHLCERDDPRRLEVMAPVASLPADCPAEVLKMAMMFNFLSADSGGARMGLCTPGDVVYVVRDIPDSEWTAAAVQQRLEQVMGVMDNWSQFFGRALGAGEPEAEPALAGQYI